MATAGRGGSGRWCPDCGETLVPGWSVCAACGLDYGTRAAREIEAANAAVHQLREEKRRAEATLARVDELTAQWIARRDAVLASAPRVRPAYGAAAFSAPHHASDAAAGVATAQDAPDAAARPTEEPQPAPPSAFAQPDAPGASPRPAEEPGPAPHAPSPWVSPGISPSSAGAANPVAAGRGPGGDVYRPARRLSAAALLGVAGAALVIIAAIVFVAASWQSYAPPVRMFVLLAFAGGFAALARTATVRGFPTIGGAIGVVAAAFVGVSQIAWRTSSGGLGPYTWSLAFVAVAAAGFALMRLRVLAVASTAAVSALLAVAGLAIEVGIRSPELETTAPRMGITAALAGAALLPAHRWWPTATQRSIVRWGGVAVALGGAVLAPLGTLTWREETAWSCALVVTGALVAAGIAAWRPVVGAGPLAGIASLVLLGAVFDVWGGLWEASIATSAVAAVMVLAAARLPERWRVPWYAGLAPLGAIMALFGAVSGLVVLDAVALDPENGRAAAPESVLGVGDVVGNAVAVACAAMVLALLMRPRMHAPRALAAVASVAGPIIGAGALLMAGFAPLRAHGVVPFLTLPAMLLVACAWWWMWRVWSARARGALQIAAVILTATTTLVAVVDLGFLRDATAGTLGVVGATVVLGVGLLALASIRMTWAVTGSTFLATLAVVAGSWRAGLDAPWTLVAGTACGAVVGAALVGRSRRADGRTGFALTGVAPALAWGTVMAALGAGHGLAIAVAPGTVGGGVALWAPASALLVGAAGVIIARVMPPRAREVVFHATATAGVASIALQGAGLVARALPEREHVWMPMVIPVLGLAALAATRMPALRRAGGAMSHGAVWAGTAFAVLGLVRLIVDEAPWRGVVAIGVAGAIGLACSVRWPRRTLAPAVAVLSLLAPAALAREHAGMAGAVAAVTSALLAWATARWWSRERIARPLAEGSLAVHVAAGLAMLAAVGVAFVAWGSDPVLHGVPTRPWLLIVASAAVAATMAWRDARRYAASIGVGYTAVAAGLVASPVGWVGATLLAVAAVEPAARWKGRWGLTRGHSVAWLAVAMTWAPASRGHAGLLMCVATLVLVWTAWRAPLASSARHLAAFPTPLTAAVATWALLGVAGLDDRAALVTATIVGLGVTLALVPPRILDAEYAPYVLAVLSVVPTLIVGNASAAGLLALASAVAWFGLAALGGPSWSRLVAYWALSPAVTLLLLGAGVTTLEAYAAVPGVTMIAFGLVRMRREAAVRTYAALAPGLGVLLIPSYLAMALEPSVLARPLALAVAAVGLAVVGVARQWFAPLLGTAATAVVIAVSQLVVDDALLPRWASFAFIGAVLLALGFTAERIRAMR